MWHCATIASEVNKGRLGLEDTTGVGVSGVDEVVSGVYQSASMVVLLKKV